MSLEEKLLNALDALAPKIDPTRSQLELDISTTAISCILSEPQGLALIEYIISELDCGKKPLYQMSEFVTKIKFDKLIEHCYLTSNNQDALNILLSCYHQFWMNDDSNSPQELYQATNKLMASNAVEKRDAALNMCLDCLNFLGEGDVKCENCNGSDLVKIIRLSLSRSVKSVLKNNQFLEIYVKECLKESGVRLIGRTAGKQDKKAYTSIQYQVQGEMIEADVHGIAQPLTLMLCEVKTAAKITMNEIRRVEGLFDRLVERVNGLAGIEISHIKLFVITGEFDTNISVGAYRRRNWELIDRARIQNLVEEFKQIRSEL